MWDVRAMGLSRTIDVPPFSQQLSASLAFIFPKLDISSSLGSKIKAMCLVWYGIREHQKARKREEEGNTEKEREREFEFEFEFKCIFFYFTFTN